MKVILTRDVRGLGRMNEEVSTADGYALNYLIPNKYAISATPAARKTAELRRKQMTDRVEVEHALLTQNIATLADAKMVITAKANEQGHLYDAVGEPEILGAARAQAHIELPEGVIKLEKPIKELGTFDVPVSSGETFGKFTITIKAEE